MMISKFRHCLQALVFVSLGGAAVAQTVVEPGKEATGDMLAFLPSVLEMAADPPPESRLKILCQVQLQADQGYATVLSIKDNKVFIIAFSPHQLERPWSTITLRGVFVPTGESHPTNEGTMDWAYVFDRNGDGKIDFFSYLVGPLWIIPSADVDRGQLPVVKDGVMIDFFNENRNKLRNGYWHVADDNFDGTLDGIVARTVDAKGWADGWVIVRDTDGDTEYDNCRATYVDLDGTLVECIEAEDGYRVPGKTFAGLTQMPLEQDEFLEGFNQVASACKFGADKFHDWPVGVARASGDEVADTDACYGKMDFEACHSLAFGGDARAQDQLGYMYANAEGEEKDDEAAVKWFRLSADQGYRLALYHLGYMHYWGRSVPEDKERAATLYLKAAEQNEAWALHALGYMYGAGEGVEKDDKKALNYIHRAAQMGHSGAQRNMGLRYAAGKGVKKDDVRAYAWWSLASMHGSSQARELLDMIAARMSRKQVKEAKELALKIHKRTLELREEQAQNDALILGISDAEP
jgi:TPR repeat protein